MATPNSAFDEKQKDQGLLDLVADLSSAYIAEYFKWVFYSSAVNCERKFVFWWCYLGLTITGLNFHTVGLTAQCLMTSKPQDSFSLATKSIIARLLNHQGPNRPNFQPLNADFDHKTQMDSVLDQNIYRPSNKRSVLKPCVHDLPLVKISQCAKYLFRSTTSLLFVCIQENKSFSWSVYCSEG